MSTVELSMNKYNLVARFSDDVTRRPNMCVVISIPEKNGNEKEKCNFLCLLLCVDVTSPHLLRF